jgi:hypothetical protein
MCLFCGDPFGPERLLAPLVGTKTCIQTGERSVLMDQEVRLGLARICFYGFLLKPIAAYPGSDAFLTPWIRNPGSVMGEKSRSGSGLNIPDHISESLEILH